MIATGALTLIFGKYATEVLGCRSSMCAENDVEATAHERLQKRQRLPDWRHRPQTGNDAIKQTTTTI